MFAKKDSSSIFANRNNNTLLMEDFSVRVPNTKDFVLRSNTIYKIMDKPDPQAPKEYQEKGLNKHPSRGLGENIVVPYSASKNVFDTCLYETSPSYSTLSAEDKVKTIKTIQKYLIPELKEFLPEEAFDQRITAGKQHFWDDFLMKEEEGIKLVSKTIFSTSNPVDFLAIWFAFLSYQICPEDEVGSPKHREMGTRFILVDRQEKSSVEQTRNYIRSKALGLFLTKLEGSEEEKAQLVTVLDYVGLRMAIDKTEPQILNGQFKRWIENGTNSFNNAEEFVETFKLYGTKAGKNEMGIYSDMKTALSKSLIRKDRNGYMFGETNLGPNLKVAAKLVTKDKTIKKAFVEALIEAEK